MSLIIVFVCNKFVWNNHVMMINRIDVKLIFDEPKNNWKFSGKTLIGV